MAFLKNNESHFFSSQDSCSLELWTCPKQDLCAMKSSGDGKEGTLRTPMGSQLMHLPSTSKGSASRQFPKYRYYAHSCALALVNSY